MKVNNCTFNYQDCMISVSKKGWYLLYTCIYFSLNSVYRFTYWANYLYRQHLFYSFTLRETYTQTAFYVLKQHVSFCFANAIIMPHGLSSFETWFLEIMILWVNKMAMVGYVNDWEYIANNRIVTYNKCGTAFICMFNYQLQHSFKVQSIF